MKSCARSVCSGDQFAADKFVFTVIIRFAQSAREAFILCKKGCSVVNDMCVENQIVRNSRSIALLATEVVLMPYLATSLTYILHYGRIVKTEGDKGCSAYSEALGLKLINKNECFGGKLTSNSLLRWGC